MSTLFVRNEPVVDEWLAQRRRHGQDRRDEVWDGVYHVSPHEHGRTTNVAMQLTIALHARAEKSGLTEGGSFNLGSPDDYRVPDLGYYRDPTPHLYFATAALVIEVISPHDETFAKFGFYAAHGVEELWVVDPLTRTVRIWQRSDHGWDESGRSDLLDTSAGAVASEVSWPQS